MTVLGQSLSGIPLPSSERAREDTIRLALEALQPQGAARGPLTSPRRARPTMAIRFAAVLAALALLLALTSPGRDAVSWAAELVGIGDDPTVTERPAELAPAGAQAVIATGTAPGGVGYEVVAYSSALGKSADSPLESCVFLDFPGTPGAGQGGVCGGLGRDTQLSSVNIADGRGAPASYLEGFAPPGAKRVAIRMSAGPRVVVHADAQIARIDDAIKGRIGDVPGATAFWAFLPSSLGANDLHSQNLSIEAVAYGAEGDVVGRDSFVLTP